jgi:nitrile hydratase accessory protein
MSDPLKPLAGVDGEPVFAEPWQAQALALADTLVQTGLFSASQWSEALGERLREAASEGAADDQQTYYACVLETLERLITAHSDIDTAAVSVVRTAWEQAYRSTPHGQPVTLDAAGKR